MENQTSATSQAVEIRTSDVLAMLKAGQTRAQINEHYGLNKNSAKALWASASLKRKKVAAPGREVTVHVIDDVQGSAPKSAPKAGTSQAAEANVTATEAATVSAPAEQANDAGATAVAAEPAQQAIADAANTASEAPATGGWGAK